MSKLFEDSKGENIAKEIYIGIFSDILLLLIFSIRQEQNARWGMEPRSVEVTRWQVQLKPVRRQDQDSFTNEKKK